MGFLEKEQTPSFTGKLLVICNHTSDGHVFYSFWVSLLTLQSGRRNSHDQGMCQRLIAGILGLSILVMFESVLCQEGLPG
jgi:hypothetical protein